MQSSSHRHHPSGGLGGGAGQSSSNGNGGSGGNAPCFFQSLGEVSGLENGQLREFFNEIGDVGHDISLLIVDPVPIGGRANRFEILLGLA